MTSRNQALVESIHAALGDRVVSIADAHGEIALVVRAGELIETMLGARLDILYSGTDEPRYLQPGETITNSATFTLPTSISGAFKYLSSGWYR